METNVVPRTIGLALGLLMLASVLYEQHRPAWEWAGPALHALVGPWLGRWLTHRSADRLRTDRLTWWADHFLSGAWCALMAFNLLPCVLAACLLAVSGGGLRLAWRGVACFGLGILAGVVVYGARWHPASGMLTVLACLPAVLLQTFLVSHTSRLAIQRLHRRREDLERRSQHDGLSGLFNRAHWETLLRAEFARLRRDSQPAALVLADLDHFKQVNDQHGHAAGDEAIRRFARALRRRLRASDSPGRYGGEEFAILLPRTTLVEAREVVERLRLDLHEHRLLDGRLVTASFGIAPLTAELDTHAEWLRLADQMLYRAKHLGRDRAVVAGDAAPAGDDNPGAAGHRGTLAAPVAAGPIELESRSTRPSSSVMAALADPAVLPHLLAGLDMSEAPLALFDAHDRLLLANLAFQNAYGVRPGQQSFDGIMRHCFEQRIGPRIETHDIGGWLAMAASRRRARPRRSFAVDMLDGRWFWAIETTFSDGWVLTTLNDISDTMPGGPGEFAPPPAGAEAARAALGATH